MTQAKSADLIEGVVFVDADNTLWDTDGVFATAQLHLLETIEGFVDKSAQTTDRLSLVRRIDQDLAAAHHQGLRYPPSLLAVALAEVLLGKPVDQAVREALKSGARTTLLSADNLSSIEGNFFRDIKSPPPLLPGVRKSLEALQKLGLTILILTEGAHQRISHTARHHKLDGLFSRILEAPKTERLFRRVLRLTGNPRVAVMIGDQLKSDIRPAGLAGLTTIHIPGRFVPRWELDDRQTRPDFQIHAFSDVVGIVEKAITNCDHAVS